MGRDKDDPTIIIIKDYIFQEFYYLLLLFTCVGSSLGLTGFTHYIWFIFTGFMRYY